MSIKNESPATFDDSRELKKEISKELRELRGLVDALCMTNFLVDYQEGDEEARKWARDHVQHQTRRVVNRFSASKEHNELFWKVKEASDRMRLLEEDYHHLKERL